MIAGFDHHHVRHVRRDVVGVARLEAMECSALDCAAQFVGSALLCSRQRAARQDGALSAADDGEVGVLLMNFSGGRVGFAVDHREVAAVRGHQVHVRALGRIQRRGDLLVEIGHLRGGPEQVGRCFRATQCRQQEYRCDGESCGCSGQQSCLDHAQPPGDTLTIAEDTNTGPTPNIHLCGFGWSGMMWRPCHPAVDSHGARE